MTFPVDPFVDNTSPVGGGLGPSLTASFFNALVDDSSLQAERIALHDGSIDTLSADSSRHAQRLVDLGVNVHDYGAVGDGTTDDTSAFASAIAALGSRGGTVQLSAKTYRVENLAVPSNIRIRGAVGGARATAGTVLKRALNVPMITAIGTSILAGGPQIRNLTFEDFRIEGADLAAPLFDFTAVTGVRWERVFFSAVTGPWLKLTEVFDSRVKDCDLEWGGTTDGTSYGVELISGGGFEYTNQIHFLQCRFESYRGTAIGSKGTNTNEIFFQSCKFESVQSSQPHLVFSNAVSLGFDNVQVTGGGSGGSITSLVAFTGCSVVLGTLLLEMAGSSTRAITSYVDVITSKSIDLTLIAYGPITPTSGFLINWDALNGPSISLRCFTTLTGVAGTNNNAPTSLTGMSSVRIIGLRGQEPSLQIQRDDRADTWSLGRVIQDGATGSQFRFMHDSTPVWVVQADNTTRWQRAFTHAVSAQTVSTAGTVTITPATANVHRLTLQANATLAFNGASNGLELTIEVIQDATGGRTVTWPSTVKFAGAAAPTDTTPNRTTILRFMYDSTSTTWKELSRSVAIG